MRSAYSLFLQLFFFSSIIFAQDINTMNKSELKIHISNLNSRIDTLISKNISLQESVKILTKKTTICEEQNKTGEKEIARLNELISNKESVIKNIKLENQNAVRILNDTINVLKEAIAKKLNSYDEEFELRYADLNKPVKPNMEDINDWLKQFNLLSQNTITYLDHEIAKFYGGDDPILDMHGKITIQNSIYKEGIIFSQKLEYEGVIYQLFIPLLNLSDAKKNIDKLCRNMGGCIQPEEMKIEYKETEFGIKVTWGGGC